MRRSSLDVSTTNGMLLARIVPSFGMLSCQTLRSSNNVASNALCPAQGGFERIPSPKGSVAKVCQECFRLIKPTMNREIVLRLATELPRAFLCVFEWMGHTYTSYVDVV